jgi:hypothetical protein
MPFAATLAAAVILIEKLLERVGFALRVFPPEETLGGCSRARCRRRGVGPVVLAFAWLAGLLTLLLIFGSRWSSPATAPPSRW